MNKPRLRKIETPPLPAAATPPVAVGYGYNDILRENSAFSSMDDSSVYSLADVGIGLAPRIPHLNKPDPICPELVLPVESWYAVGFESICQTGPIHIYGRGKQLLLTAYVNHNETTHGKGSVMLGMGDNHQGRFLGSITNAGNLMLQDHRRQTYGEIISRGNLIFSLKCG